MTRRLAVMARSLAACLALLGLAARSGLAAETASREDLFEIHARPLLVVHCLRCHGEAKQEGGLNLATRAGMLAGGDSGPAVVPCGMSRSRCRPRAGSKTR